MVIKILILFISAKLALACNTEATYQRAISILRAYNCKQAKTLDGCETQLGLGSLTVAGGLIAKSLSASGKVLSKQVRNPEVSFCPISLKKTTKHLFPINILVGEPLWASCVDIRLAAQSQLGTSLKIMKNDLTSLIAKQEEELVRLRAATQNSGDPKLISLSQKYNDLSKETNRILEGGEHQLELLRNRANKLSQQLAIGFKDISDVAYESDQQIFEYYRNKALELSRSKKWTSDQAINFIGNLEDWIKNNAALELHEKEVQKLFDSPNYKKAVEARANAFLELKDYENTLSRDSRKISLGRALTPDESKQEMAMLKNLKHLQQKQQDVSDLLTKVSKANLSVKDIEGIIDAASKVGHTSDLAINSLLRNESAFARGLGSGISAQNLLPGKWHKLLLKPLIGVVSSAGIMSAASAADLDKAVDNADPFRIGSAGDDKCSDMLPSKYFKRTPEKQCHFDFSYNEKILSLIAGDKQAFLEEVKTHPEICEFIYNQWRSNYKKAKSVCSNPIKVNFDSGAYFEISSEGKTGSIKAKTSTTPMINIFLDEFGSEKKISSSWSNPRSSLKGSLMEANWGEPSPWSEIIKGQLTAYEDHKISLVEIRSCCNNTGVRPTNDECAFYGINLNSVDSSSESRSATK